jgi:hypothetical protein
MEQFMHRSLHSELTLFGSNCAVNKLQYSHSPSQLERSTTMAPLKPGDTVWTKSKPHREGIIKAATNKGPKHEWIV